MQADQHQLVWENQPLPFKIYTSLDALPLTTSFRPAGVGALAAIAGHAPSAAADAQRDTPRATPTNLASSADAAVTSSDSPALGRATLARLCYFSNGVTKVLHRMPFRAAACTGAMYHIELYLVCGALSDLEAGVYHYGAHDNALRQLRHGDFRQAVLAATGDEPSVAQAPVIMALTSTWWRNAWKYQARAYRHAFWDSGTILANLLAVASGQSIQARVIVGFADDEVNALLGVDREHEAAICLVALGVGHPATQPAPPAPRLDLPTRALSHHEVRYAEIVDAHRASSLSSGAVASWRSALAQPSQTSFELDVPTGESIEAVILRRGSSRRFSLDPLTAADLDLLLRVATAAIDTDAPVLSTLYLIVNAVDGLASGAYAFDRSEARLELLRPGTFRREARYLDLGQELAGDAAVDVYWLIDLDQLDDRAYRAAQLLAAIEAGKLYLAAYALGLGATGLTFFDDDVTRFFGPHAAGKSVMFLTAVGHPRRRRS